MDKLEELFKISPRYKEKRKREGSSFDSDGRRMSPILRSVYEKAIRAYYKKNYREALTLFVNLLSQNVQSSVCTYFSGICAMQLKNEEAAQKYFEQTVKLKKNYYHVMYSHIFLAYFYIKKNDLQEAVEWLRLPIKNEFESPLAYSFMGYIANQKKNYELAAKYYKKSLVHDAENPSFKNNLGFTYLEWNKNLNEAEKLIKEAVRHDKKNPSYLHSWGWFFLLRKKFKEAVVLFNKAFSFGQHNEIKRDLELAKQKLEDS